MNTGGQQLSTWVMGVEFHILQKKTFWQAVISTQYYVLV